MSGGTQSGGCPDGSGSVLVTDVEPPALEARGVCGGYRQTQVLWDVSLKVSKGHVLALLGANGAGKTTILRALSGSLRITQGMLLVDGADTTRLSPAKVAKRGLCLIPEGRGIFRSLTVRENLRLQVPPWLDESESTAIDIAVGSFPGLGQRLSQQAGTLSGGEQQMLALSRALVSKASIILLDEVSMGLAPIVIDQLFEVLKALAVSGRSLILVEQYVDRALQIADEVAVLDRGTVAYAGNVSGLNQERLLENYFGSAG